MLNVSVATTVTPVLPAENRGNATVFIQNQSDTGIRLAFGAANIALLSQSLGAYLDLGESITISGPEASRAISAIHVGGSGTKSLHWQLI